MSRAILVRVSESVVRTVHVEDGVESPLEMLPILAPERQSELLATELEGQGFEREGDTMKRTEPDGIEIVVDLKNAKVSVKLGANADLAETLERQGRSYDDARDRDKIEENLRDQVIAELDERLTERTEAMRRQVTQQLEKKLGDLRSELDDAVGRATVAALTERANQLGQVESVHGDEAGNVTIRVKL
ncbi:MAG: hypothetical protein H0T79_04940 [Deltaproteobacteria bacterium]|nr:hypothetical protein [Deltaproteobacteria bacterium]